MLNVLTQLTVSSAVSRKNQGGTDFDVPLPLPPNNRAVEPRVGGLTNDYTIIVNFNDSVTVGGNPQAQLIAGSGTIGSGGTPNGGMVTVSGNTVTIPLTNVTNQQVIQVRLNGVNGASFIIPMGVLVGDTNGDGSVSASPLVSPTSTAHGDDEAGAVHAIKPHLDDLLIGHVCERNGNGISTNRAHAAIRRPPLPIVRATGD